MKKSSGTNSRRHTGRDGEGMTLEEALKRIDHLEHLNRSYMRTIKMYEDTDEVLRKANSEIQRSIDGISKCVDVLEEKEKRKAEGQVLGFLMMLDAFQRKGRM